MTGLISDLRYAARSLFRERAANLAIVATVGLGICASATVFTVLDALILRPLPAVAAQSRLVNVHATGADGSSFHDVSYPTWKDLASANRSFLGIAAFTSRIVSIDEGIESRLGVAQLVTGNYFTVLGTKPALGRLLTAADGAAPGRGAVAVLSDSVWKHQFSGDPAIVGRTLRVNARPFVIVGVAPPGFQGTFLGFPFDVWVPTAMAGVLTSGQSLDERGSDWLEMVGRLKPGVTPVAARADLNTIARQLQRDFPESHRGIGFDPRPTTGFEDSLREPAIRFFSLLAALGLLVLAIACANVTGILFARATARAKEIGLRLALGSPRQRLVRLMTIEHSLLFLGGGAAGLLATYWTTPLLERFRIPIAMPIRFDFSPGPRTALFALAASLAAGLLFGVIPGLTATRQSLLQSLRGGSATDPLAVRRLSSGFVLLQVAFSVPLLVSAGLLLRTVQNATQADPGFTVRGLSMSTLDLSILGYDRDRASRFFSALEERVKAIPGVNSVTLTSGMPLGPGHRSLFASLPGENPADKRLEVDFAAVGRDYFSTLRIRLLRGRTFAREDGPGTLPVAVINTALARLLWPGREAIGQALVENGRTVTVVGVAQDGKYRRLWESPRPFLYLPEQQVSPLRRDLVIRSSGSSAGLATGLRRELKALEPALPPSATVPVSEYIGISLLPQRAAGAVAAGLGAVGLLLAAIGLTGLVTWSVARRRREIAIRMALGARPVDVLRLEMQRGLLLAAGGLVLGGAGTLASTRLIARMLFGVGSADPRVLGAVALMMGAATLVATFLPARRAARTDPIRALRSM
jgi:predicted permease